jgi:hypothetical protein
MSTLDLKNFIKKAIRTKLKREASNKYKEYRILNNVPDMIPILIDLMSEDFVLFVNDIYWIAPKPPTFKVILENEQSFYLIDLGRSWVAEVEGKKYYLLNLGEEEMAINAIARILRYGKPVNPQVEGADTSIPGDEMEASVEAPPPGEQAPETVDTPVGEIPAEFLET